VASFVSRPPAAADVLGVGMEKPRGRLRELVYQLKNEKYYYFQ